MSRASNGANQSSSTSGGTNNSSSSHHSAQHRTRFFARSQAIADAGWKVELQVNQSMQVVWLSPSRFKRLYSLGSLDEALKIEESEFSLEDFSFSKLQIFDEIVVGTGTLSMLERAKNKFYTFKQSMCLLSLFSLSLSRFLSLTLALSVCF